MDSLIFYFKLLYLQEYLNFIIQNYKENKLDTTEFTIFILENSYSIV